jgi:hypothetical protein
MANKTKKQTKIKVSNLQQPPEELDKSAQKKIKGGIVIKQKNVEHAVGEGSS